MTARSERLSAAPAPTASLESGAEDVEPEEGKCRTADHGNSHAPPRNPLHLERTCVRLWDPKSPTLSGESVADGGVQPHRGEDHITGLAADQFAMHGGDIIDGNSRQVEARGAFEMYADERSPGGGHLAVRDVMETTLRREQKGQKQGRTGLAAL